MMAQLSVLVAGMLMLATARPNDTADYSKHQGFLSKYMSFGSAPSKSSFEDYSMFMSHRLNFLRDSGGSDPRSYEDGLAEHGPAKYDLNANGKYGGVKIPPRADAQDSFAFTSAGAMPLVNTRDFEPPKIADKEEEKALQEALQKLLDHRSKKWREEAIQILLWSSVGVGLLILGAFQGFRMWRGVQPATAIFMAAPIPFFRKPATLELEAREAVPLELQTNVHSAIHATLPSVETRLLDEAREELLEPHAVAGHIIDLQRGPPTTDPFELVKRELVRFSDNTIPLVQSENEMLSDAAALFFDRSGKRFRPTIVMLLAKALPVVDTTEDVFNKQIRLGQVTEMIHVASLIHDDVLDDADTRRGGEAVHIMYNNKVAVCSGDYLLARASVLLARLQNPEVVVVMARALDSLVSGEIMQIKANQAADKKSSADDDEQGDSRKPVGQIGRARAAFGKMSWKNRIRTVVRLGRKRRRLDSESDTDVMELYLRKSYYKTASLICDASKSCALLAGHATSSEIAVGAQQFGYHLGLAFQIIDDVLDFVQDDEALGKPAGADMSLGLATAPVLFAAQEQPELWPLINRAFKGPGDVGVAYNAVRNSRGLDMTRKLARFHAQKAVDILCRIAPHSEARDALISICYIVLSRSK
jgi:geranylgeranyl pyrophosphate synthase